MKINDFQMVTIAKQLGFVEKTVIFLDGRWIKKTITQCKVIEISGMMYKFKRLYTTF